jgi:hypothetical protein
MGEPRMRYHDDRVVYRVSEVARILDCDHARIYRHIAAGSLVAFDLRPAGAAKPTYRISRASVDALLANARVTPASANDVERAGEQNR